MMYMHAMENIFFRLPAHLSQIKEESLGSDDYGVRLLSLLWGAITVIIVGCDHSDK